MKNSDGCCWRGMGEACIKLLVFLSLFFVIYFSFFLFSGLFTLTLAQLCKYIGTQPVLQDSGTTHLLKDKPLFKCFTETGPPSPLSCLWLPVVYKTSNMWESAEDSSYSTTSRWVPDDQGDWLDPLHGDRSSWENIATDCWSARYMCEIQAKMKLLSW